MRTTVKRQTIKALATRLLKQAERCHDEEAVTAFHYLIDEMQRARPYIVQHSFYTEVRGLCYMIVQDPLTTPGMRDAVQFYLDLLEERAAVPRG